MGLIGYPKKEEESKEHRYKYLELFYVSTDNKFFIINNMEVLYSLREHRECSRFVPEKIEKPDEKTVAIMKSLIEKWMNRKAVVEEEQLTIDIFDGRNLKVKQFNDLAPEARYRIENYDLITWFVVSRNKIFLDE